MNVAWEPSEDLVGLIESLCAGEISPDQFARLSDMILSDPSARRYYVRYLRVHANLPRILHPADVLEGKRKGERFAECEFGVRQPFGASVSGPLFDPFGQSAAVVPDMVGAEQGDAIFRPSPPPRTSPFVFDVGEHAFSYMVATVFVCLMLLGFWAYKISPDDDASIADNNSRRSTTSGEESIQVSPAPAIVGRITGIVGAKWFDDPDYLPPLGVNVRLGRQYKLKSGLLEITYDSGAKVILEGPCSYEVESTRGGYLSLGKLVARVGAGDEGRGAGEVASGQWPVASMKEESGRMKDEGGRPNADSLATRHQSLATNPSPLSPLPSPLFTVRTPTAVVTDLGTEFSVEVGTNGDIFSHVYRGTVRVELVGQPDGGVMLREQESVQVSSAAKRLVKVDFSPADADKFFRLMPVRERIEVFNTGYGLAEGEADPHWQVVAASNDPDFKPRLAMVTIVNRPSQFRPNDPARSQWISTVPDLSDVPNGVTYTFRTTFELTDLVPGSAKLRIGFLADNRVQAVRLNGAPVAVPEHGHLAPFYVLNRMIIEEGFVAGANVLEIDVFNGAPESGSSPASPMALLVELEGTMLRGGRAAAVNAPDDKPRANEGRGVNDERSLNHQNYSYFGNRLSCLCLKRG